MPLSALLLVLLAALLPAGWNTVAKRAAGDERFSLLSSLLITVRVVIAGHSVTNHCAVKVLATDPVVYVESNPGLRLPGAGFITADVMTPAWA